MSILPKINLDKLSTPSVRALFLIWLFFSITILTFYFQIRVLHHIDVPTLCSEVKWL
jgi:hypothetical protein